MGFSLYGTGDWEEERMREEDLELSVLLDIGACDKKKKWIRAQARRTRRGSCEKKTSSDPCCSTLPPGKGIRAQATRSERMRREEGDQHC